jgi:hypothetical protein
MTVTEMFSEALSVGDAVEVRRVGVNEWLCGVSFFEGGGVTSRGQSTLEDAMNIALDLAINARLGAE